MEELPVLMIEALAMATPLKNRELLEEMVGEELSSQRLGLEYMAGTDWLESSPAEESIQ